MKVLQLRKAIEFVPDDWDVIIDVDEGTIKDITKVLRDDDTCEVLLLTDLEDDDATDN